MYLEPPILYLPFVLFNPAVILMVIGVFAATALFAIYGTTAMRVGETRLKSSRARLLRFMSWLMPALAMAYAFYHFNDENMMHAAWPWQMTVILGCMPWVMLVPLSWLLAKYTRKSEDT